MKKILYLFIIVLLFNFTSCNKLQDENTINVYCYDSFVGDFGPGKKIAEDFENKTGIHVNLISCAGSVQLYSKILFESDKCIADAVIGLPDSIEIDTSIFSSWEPACKQDLIEYDNPQLIPFNYGVFAFIMDTGNSNVNEPQSLYELTKPEYKDKIILIDPRTSSVGLGLLQWTKACLEDDFIKWWKDVMNNALTITDSWSSAYGLFTEGEAPLVLSYSTSPVYHLLYEGKTNYKALCFEEGHILTKEYLAIMNKSSKKELAEKFCEYILTEGQKEIALANTMFPANTKTELPDAYKNLINPVIINNKNNIENDTDSLINQWLEVSIQ